MKVVTQLIHHLWNRGALSIDQVDHLVRHGFVQPEDLAGFEGRPVVAEPCATEREVALEVVAEELTRCATKARRKKSRRRVQVVNLKVLGDWLQEEFDRRAEAFPALVALASTFRPCTNWVEAAVILRNVPANQFVEGLRDALRARPSLLGDLWRSVDPEPFHVLAAAPALRGSAARAFRVLLQTEAPNQLGKYAWILKAPEVAAVSNLLRIERRLLNALGRPSVREDGGVSSALNQGLPSVLYWAFVYQYNAERTPTDDEPASPSRESGPLERPDDVVRRQAITCALMMNPSGLLRLLEMEDQQRPLVRPWPWRMPPAA